MFFFSVEEKSTLQQDVKCEKLRTKILFEIVTQLKCDLMSYWLVCVVAFFLNKNSESSKTKICLKKTGENNSKIRKGLVRRFLHE